MEEFRKKVQRRLQIYTLLCCGSGAMYFVLKFLTSGASEFAQGLTMGVLVGFELVAVYNLVRMFIATRNEEKLRQMYIEETDERNCAIAKETAQKGSVISMMGISLAAIVAGFFDVKVCMTLVAALLASALITILVNLYYKKKM